MGEFDDVSYLTDCLFNNRKTREKENKNKEINTENDNVSYDELTNKNNNRDQVLTIAL